MDVIGLAGRGGDISTKEKKEKRRRKKKNKKCFWSFELGKIRDGVLYWGLRLRM